MKSLILNTSTWETYRKEQRLVAIMGSYIFEFIGVTCRWIFNLVKSYLRGTRPRTFKEVWDADDDFSSSDLLMYGFMNVLLGAAILLIIIQIISWIDRRAV